MKLKKCSNKNCQFKNLEQEIDNFYSSSRSKDGYSSWCKNCFKNNRQNIKNINIASPSINFKKICLICEIEKNSNDFHNRLSVLDGKTSICKICWAVRQKILHRQDPRIELLKKAKRRANEKNIEFSLLLDDLVIPKICPVLGIEIKVGDGKVMPYSPSIDRIDNNKGYIKDNVRIISWRANSLKSDANIDELRALLRDAESRQIRDEE